MDALAALRLRTRRLTETRTAADGDYVLCWLMQALRAEENPTLDAAIALGNAGGLPVVVVHTVETAYPYASHRLSRFMLEASRELEAGIEARGLRFVRYLRRASGEARETQSTAEVVGRLAERAVSVVVDDIPTFVTRTYADTLAANISREVLAVDACCAVPMNAFPTPLATTKAFRAAHTRLRPDHLGLDLRQRPEVDAFDGDLDIVPTPLADLDASGLDALCAAQGIDMSLPPVERWHGGREAALERLRFAVDEVVPQYKWTRNNPALENASAEISPWMHFGQLSPREVAEATLEAEASGAVHRDARWKFLDETLTWREYYHHRCRTVPGFSNWSGLPEDARETMRAHADDPRPEIYSVDELLHGETDDPLWNAAQKQFLLDGWMNNNLRMYWVKQILKWCPTPEAAFATACYLNDRLSYDGRDASTYGGIRWGFGEGKPGADAPIYGTVSRKTAAALIKRKGVPEWIEREASRVLPYRVDVPEAPPELARYA